MISEKTQKMQLIILILLPILLIILFIIIRNSIILPRTRYYKIENYYSGSLKNKSSYNDYTFNYITIENLINRIFYDYKNKLISNPKEAYKLITKKNKSNLFKNYSEFEKYLKENNEKIINSKIVKYSSKDNAFKVLDQYNYKYTFNYTNPVTYKVNIEAN